MAAKAPVQTQFNLRLPQSLKDALQAASEQGKRSINLEMVARLQRSFELERLVERYRMQADADAVDIQRLRSEISSKDAEQTDFWRRRAEDSEKMREQMGKLADAVGQWTKNEEEVRNVIRYLEGDAVCIDAELRQEDVIPVIAPPPPPMSLLAERLRKAIDAWALRLTRLAGTAVGDDEDAPLLKVLAHTIDRGSRK